MMDENKNNDVSVARLIGTTGAPLLIGALLLGSALFGWVALAAALVVAAVWVGLSMKWWAEKHFAARQ